MHATNDEYYRDITQIIILIYTLIFKLYLFTNAALLYSILLSWNVLNFSLLTLSAMGDFTDQKQKSSERR